MYAFLIKSNLSWTLIHDCGLNLQTNVQSIDLQYCSRSVCVLYIYFQNLRKYYFLVNIPIQTKFVYLDRK